MTFSGVDHRQDPGLSWGPGTTKHAPSWWLCLSVSDEHAVVGGNILASYYSFTHLQGWPELAGHSEG